MTAHLTQPGGTVPGAEQALIRHISKHADFVEVGNGIRDISAFAGIASDLNLSVQQVRGALANLCQKREVDTYVRGDGMRRYWLTENGRERAKNLLEQNRHRTYRLRTASFAN